MKNQHLKKKKKSCQQRVKNQKYGKQKCIAWTKTFEQDEEENISDEVESLLDRPVKLDVWASYLPGPNVLSKTLRQLVNMSYCEHMRNKTGGRQCLPVMPGKSFSPVACVARRRCACVHVWVSICVCECNKP